MRVAGNAACGLDKGVAYAACALRCAWYIRKDMADYSEDQGAKCAANAIMPQSGFALDLKFLTLDLRRIVRRKVDS